MLYVPRVDGRCGTRPTRFYPIGPIPSARRRLVRPGKPPTRVGAVASLFEGGVDLSSARPGRFLARSTGPAGAGRAIRGTVHGACMHTARGSIWGARPVPTWTSPIGILHYREAGRKPPTPDFAAAWTVASYHVANQAFRAPSRLPSAHVRRQAPGAGRNGTGDGGAWTGRPAFAGGEAGARAGAKPALACAWEGVGEAVRIGAEP